MSSQKIPYLDTEELERRASEFRDQFNVTEKVCPIEKIVDVELGIDIVPIPRLHRKIHTNGALSIDLSTIWVDEYCCENLEEKYRFTLAHEIAHWKLHRDVYQELRAQSITEYTRILTELLTEEQYQSFEWQADYFAGGLLVPPDSLKEDFESYLDDIKSRLEEIDYQDKSRQMVFRIALRELCDRISSEYQVSPVTIDARLAYRNFKEKLATELFRTTEGIQTEITYRDV